MRSSHVIAAITIAAAVGGCSQDQSSRTPGERMAGVLEVICLNGIKYYAGHNTLAPYFDHVTLNVVRCEINKE